MDLYFEPYEYQDIKLNDQIIINSQVYRINKIKGFNISKRDVVTVELLRLYPEYIAVPQGPSNLPPTPTPSPTATATPTPTPTPSPTPGGDPTPTPTSTPTPTPTPDFTCEELTIGANSSGDFIGATGTCCDGTLFDERVEDYGEVTIVLDRDWETSSSCTYKVTRTICTYC